MDEVERITVSLPFTDELRDAVAAGEYASPDAAVAEALEAWSAERLIARIGVERLREHWDRGIASGKPQPLDLEDVLRRAFVRADEIRAADAVPVEVVWLDAAIDDLETLIAYIAVDNEGADVRRSWNVWQVSCRTIRGWGHRVRTSALVCVSCPRPLTSFSTGRSPIPTKSRCAAWRSSPSWPAGATLNVCSSHAIGR